MYKVFLNDRILAIASKEELKPEYSDFKIIEPGTRKDLKQRVNHFLKSTGNICLLFDDSKKIFTEVFSTQFINIKAAGGVVLKNGQILFIFRKGYWDLPKGKIDKGENAKEAALREVEEETGIKNLKIIKTLPSTWHIYQSPYNENKGSWILKETLWFEMETSGIQNLVPQTEEGITKVEWISKNQFGKVTENTYANLKQIISLYR